jgi:hypothetical protein
MARGFTSLTLLATSLAISPKHVKAGNKLAIHLAPGRGWPCSPRGVMPPGFDPFRVGLGWGRFPGVLPPATL